MIRKFCNLSCVLAIMARLWSFSVYADPGSSPEKNNLRKAVSFYASFDEAIFCEVLATAIGRIVRGEISWPQLRNNAYQRHADHFSDRAMASRVADVYRELFPSSAR